MATELQKLIKRLTLREEASADPRFTIHENTSYERLSVVLEENERKAVTYLSMSEILLTGTDQEGVQEVRLMALGQFVIMIQGKEIKALYEALKSHRVAEITAGNDLLVRYLSWEEWEKEKG